MVNIPINREAVRRMSIGDSSVTTIEQESAGSAFWKAGMKTRCIKGYLISDDRLTVVTVITFIGIADQEKYDKFIHKRKPGTKKGTPRGSYKLRWQSNADKQTEG